MRRNKWEISDDIKKEYPQIKDVSFGSGYSFTESGNGWAVELKDGFYFDGSSIFFEATVKDIKKTMRQIIQQDITQTNSAEQPT